MRRFELLTIKCKMCDWQWEVTPNEKTDNIICEHCGSNDVIIEKETLQMIKKNGKFLTDIGFSNTNNRFDIRQIEDFTTDFEKPLLVIKENDIRLPCDMTNQDRISILGKIDSLKSRILEDIKNSNDDSFTHLK